MPRAPREQVSEGRPERRELQLKRTPRVFRRDAWHEHAPEMLLLDRDEGLVARDRKARKLEQRTEPPHAPLARAEHSPDLERPEDVGEP